MLCQRFVIKPSTIHTYTFIHLSIGFIYNLFFGPFHPIWLYTNSNKDLLFAQQITFKMSAAHHSEWNWLNAPFFRWMSQAAYRTMFDILESLLIANNLSIQIGAKVLLFVLLLLVLLFYEWYERTSIKFFTSNKIWIEPMHQCKKLKKAYVLG